MTHEQKAQSYFVEWLKEEGTVPYGPEDMIEFAAYCLEQEVKDQYQPLLFNTDWPEVNTTLLVNFLRLPENHKKSLIEGMIERRPDLFLNEWKAEYRAIMEVPPHNPDVA